MCCVPHLVSASWGSHPISSCHNSKRFQELLGHPPASVLVLHLPLPLAQSDGKALQEDLGSFKNLEPCIWLVMSGVCRHGEPLGFWQVPCRSGNREGAGYPGFLMANVLHT